MSWPQQRLRTHQVIAYESGMAGAADPFGGSYAVFQLLISSLRFIWNHHQLATSAIRGPVSMRVTTHSIAASSLRILQAASLRVGRALMDLPTFFSAMRSS